jgi:O-antigen/teichoic acid export membrane protein
MFTLSRIFHQAQSIKKEFYGTCAFTVATAVLHFAGFACSFHYREAGKRVLVVAGSGLALCLVCFYVYFAFYLKLWRPRDDARKHILLASVLFTFFVLLANSLLVLLDSIDKILQVCGRQQYRHVN